ncbi:hypothetical protein DLM46_14480 [Paraburkholderia lacunae]|uniref:Uncharacterized protein n=1 Tax=Paraburkholderia lacunae TaxID=2211104 RepID=A0A370N945_9BURK|nr:hypothetical protein DLM46_14480 [Paraburkholderia lacunae]
MRYDGGTRCFDLATTSGVDALEVFGPNGFVRKFAGNVKQTASQASQIGGRHGSECNRELF